MGDNIDYLKLAKVELQALRDRRDKGVGTNLREFIFQEASLAVQIAQVEATERLATETHLSWCANDPDRYDSVPFEEDHGESCVHGLNVASPCFGCRKLLEQEDERIEATRQNIADRVENQSEAKPESGLLKRISDRLGPARPE